MIHKLSLQDEIVYKSSIPQNVCDESLYFVQEILNDITDKSWNCDIRTSKNITNNILNNKRLSNLKINILHHLDNYMHEKGEYFDGYIDSSWVNIYEKNFYQEFHTHISPVKKTISGVMYLSRSNSNINFEAPSRMKQHKLTPEYCDIILFEDYLAHSVEKNQSDNLRISVAFNFTKVNLHRQ